MTYATQADLEQRFGADELADLVGGLGAGEPGAQAVALALADACAEVDGYLASRYQLPLPVVPGVLVRVACDVARYRLWADAASDEVRRRYDDATRLLANISRGVVALGLGQAQTAPTPSQASFAGGSAKVFGREATDGF